VPKARKTIVTKVNVIGALLALAHIVTYGWMLYRPESSVNDSGWNRLGFLMLWQIIDFPVGLLAILGAWTGYWEWIQRVFGEGSLVALLLYPFHLVHVVLGSLWWFMMPRFVVWVRR
jgi:hypothetical protein